MKTLYQNHNKKSKITLIILVFLISQVIYAQQGELVKTVIPKADRTFNLSVEYFNDRVAHCKTPIKYTIRESGNFAKNTILQWTFQYIPCDGNLPVKKLVKLPVNKGSSNKTLEIQIFSRNIITRYDENSLKIRTIDDPQFEIAAPDKVMEGDIIHLRINSSSGSDVKWVWAKANRTNIVQTEKLTLEERTFGTTKYIVWGEIEGFHSPEKEVTVQVIRRPDAPSGFTIEGADREITDIESARLSITPNSTLDNVDWIWEVDGVEVGRGLELTVSPNKTTVYTVHSEYYWKKSISKTVRVNVRVLPEAPRNFEIIAPQKITEGQSVWLRIQNKGSEPDVHWTWFSNGKTVVGDSLLVSPLEKTTYKLYAERNGKKSLSKTIEIDVIQLARAPRINGSLKRCVTDTKSNVITLSGGKLGSGSNNWVWYEGVCGTGKLIHTGDAISLSPNKTSTYSVRPDNNTAACTEFTIEVGSVPKLPETFTAPNLVCATDNFKIETTGNPDSGSTWLWSSRLVDGTNYTTLGEFRSMNTSIYASTTFYVHAENEYCVSSTSKSVTVNVRGNPPSPNQVMAYQRKNKNYSLVVDGPLLNSETRWTWYKDDCNGTPLGYGKEIHYTAGRTNNIFVRAESVCDSSTCKSTSFNYKKQLSKFIFLNLGFSANKIYENIRDFNAHMSIGSNRIYLSFKVPMSKIITDSVSQLMDLGPELNADNTRITNYPNGIGSYYVFTGKSSDELYAASGGIMLGSNTLKIYLGAGYGQRKLYYYADVYDYNSNRYLGKIRATNLIQSISGPLAEGGIFLKFGSVNLMGGMDMIIDTKGNTYRSGYAGIGFSFNRGYK